MVYTKEQKKEYNKTYNSQHNKALNILKHKHMKQFKKILLELMGESK